MAAERRMSDDEAWGVFQAAIDATEAALTATGMSHDFRDCVLFLDDMCGLVRERYEGAEWADDDERPLVN